MIEITKTAIPPGFEHAAYQVESAIGTHEAIRIEPMAVEESVKPCIPETAMKQIKVWYGENHDDYTTATIEVADPASWVEKARIKGGFWLDGNFVLWHRINFIERIEEETKP